MMDQGRSSLANTAHTDVQIPIAHDAVRRGRLALLVGEDAHDGGSPALARATWAGR
jgi:hypothetical protein